MKIKFNSACQLKKTNLNSLIAIVLLAACYITCPTNAVFAQDADSSSEESANSSNEAPSSDEGTPKKQTEKSKPDADSNSEPTEIKAGTEQGSEAEVGAKKVVSASSKKLSDRLGLGTDLGWTTMSSKGATWNVAGASSIFAVWRRSSKDTGRTYLTFKYLPVAGSVKYDQIWYDATAHGFLFGGLYSIPMGEKKMALKLGGDVGYMKVYARAQGLETLDAAVTSGKFIAGFASRLEWTVLEKMQLGPYLNAYAGTATIFQLGAATTLMF